MAEPPIAGSQDASSWLRGVLQQNAASGYLRHYGMPRDVAAFRANLPLADYETLQPWIDRIEVGERDVLFAGRPVGFERTGGSSGGAKIVPYSAAGLADFRCALEPWIGDVIRRHAITGRVYLATSPATRPPQMFAGMPLGLPDGAYLGEYWGAWIAAHSAVPLELAREPCVDAWRTRTLAALRDAADLELISVWSPTLLLRLLDDLPEPRTLWPRLHLISCWADGSSRAFADEVRARVPHAHLQPKGLLSTECVVTVPDDDDRPRLNPHGFFEFLRADGAVLLPQELAEGDACEVVATTSSGLYRYRTGDLVRCVETDAHRPILVFVGRTGLASDLVGEKLTDAFVGAALEGIAGFRFLKVQHDRCGYELVTDREVTVDLDALEVRLQRNPQYAHARRLGQLHPLRHRRAAGLHDRYVAAQVARGVRLADVKPISLLLHADWLDSTGEAR